MVTKAAEKQVNDLYRLQMSDGSPLENNDFQLQLQQSRDRFHRHPLLSWPPRKGMNKEEVDQSK